MPTPPSRCLAYRGPDAPHDFDRLSGWCLYGCGLRDDGRHQSTGGAVIDPGPEYTPDQLDQLAHDLRRTDHEQTHTPQPTLDLDQLDLADA